MFEIPSSKKADWLIPAGLILLSVIPLIAGAVRLTEIMGGVVTPENARFLTMPIPAVLHIISSLVFCMLGALQFSSGLRCRHPIWHRMLGCVLIPCGMLSALTALWMTHLYPVGVVSPAVFDGELLYAVRWLVGIAMLIFLVQGWLAVKRRNIMQHQANMMRAYALGLGAGTQVITHIPWVVFPSIHGELARALCMAAGWAINLVVVELILARQRHRFGKRY
jgi:uncharacterized membrane protein